MMTQDNDNSHYFSATPSGDARRHEFTVPGPHGELHLVSESGVFSQHGLDKGTAVFLDTMRKASLPEIADGSALLDIGCGTGAIALTLAALYPQCMVYAIDVNERARALCAENAATNKLKNVVVLAPEEVNSSLEFALVWSNPPIRIGKDALHELLTLWLSKLSSRGVAHLVVSKNLGADSLKSWMESLHYTVNRLGSSKGFRVLEVTR